MTFCQGEPEFTVYKWYRKDRNFDFDNNVEAEICMDWHTADQISVISYLE